MSKELSRVLIEELVESFNESLSKKGILLPKIFIGVNSENRQFSINMSDLQLEVGQHPDFMRYVLFYEKSIAFAFKMRTQSVSEEPEILREEHMFLSGETNSYHSMVLTHKLEDSWVEGSKKIHENHTNEPEIFFQDLLGKTYKSTDEDSIFHDIWNSAQEKVSWSERNTIKNWSERKTIKSTTFFQKYKRFFWKSYIGIFLIPFILALLYSIIEYG